MLIKFLWLIARKLIMWLSKYNITHKLQYDMSLLGNILFYSARKKYSPVKG